MARNRLVLGIAAVFAGLTAVLTVLAFVEQLFLLFVALPFGATAYLLWYHATGRLAARTRRRARAGRTRTAGTGARQAGAAGRTAGTRSGRADGGAAGRSTGRRVARDDRPTRAEAYRTLGLDPGASPDEVRRAYRAKVKQVHPDTDSGDEESFKRVNRAYQRLVDSD